ncbi:MAG: hypothetical protein KME49_12445 [Brasilonema octagenarum HA4186-MV1]|jgi:hypothetical protein|nr:hypothetical protein [Brasilonema octagenarum HA4186-MV1]
MLTQVQAHHKKDFFTEMQDAFSQLEHQPLRKVLLDSLQAEQDSVRAIDASFQNFTSKKHSPQVCRLFFASWQRTNNTAMSVAGLANRITHEAELVLSSGENLSVALELFRSAGRLNRVIDEDLGLKGQTLHFELYYRMATKFSGNDDAWQSREFCLPSASDFKSWLDSARLVEPMMNGLFSMLIHEGYTHGELESIAPMFEKWAIEIMGLNKSDARRYLAWIAVHNGGTEKHHFAHACAAFEHYYRATLADINLEVASQIFQNYLRRKGEVMKQINEKIHGMA